MEDDTLTGELFAGKYQVQERLGAGGAGRVYRARHQVLHRTVALKVLHRSLLGDARTIKRFEREARAACRVAHPNIVGIHDFGYTDRGIPYLVMEFVRGKVLSEVIAAEGQLPVPRLMGILQQVAMALAAAHEANVIHRDLKPSNIMLSNAGRWDEKVKILDFGVAKIVHATISQQLTTRETLIGTPEYMAPEQITGEEATEQSDLYALGVLGFQLITARVPFAGALMKVLDDHVQTPPPSPAGLSGRGDISPQLERLVLCCLAKDPAGRPGSAVQLLEQLNTMRI